LIHFYKRLNESLKMSSEKFCLRWNDFETNISGAFRELRDDKDFFDVTIACEDEQMQAHKVILSACSPFFRNILRRNQHQHPLLYLKGVKYTDLQSVLNFMYHGEVNVAQEELNSFLSVAEDLRVKGLTQSQGNATSTRHREQSPPRSSKPRVVEREPPPPPKRPKPPATQTFTSVQQQSTNFTPQDQDDDIQELPPVKTEPRDTPVYPAPAIQVNHPDPQDDAQQHQLVQQDQYGEEGTMGEYEDYGQYGDSSYDDGQYGQVMGQQADGGKGLTDPSQLEQFIVKEQTGYMCSVCNIFTHNTKHHVRNHVESKHFPNTFLYSCPTCGKEVFTRKALERHKTGCKKLTNTDTHNY